MKRHHIKIPTAQRLKNIALHYLSRYAASEASLRRVLHNRLRRAWIAYPDFAADETRQKELQNAIEHIIETHKASGILNDRALAEIKVASLRRAGRSGSYIQQKLALGGLARDLVIKALNEYDGEDNGQEADAKAALAFCKRRRLGQFRPKSKEKEGDGRRDFAALARAGYSPSVIWKVLNWSPEAETQDDFG